MTGRLAALPRVTPGLSVSGFHSVHPARCDAGRPGPRDVVISVAARSAGVADPRPCRKNRNGSDRILPALLPDPHVSLACDDNARSGRHEVRQAWQSDRGTKHGRTAAEVDRTASPSGSGAEDPRRDGRRTRLSRAYRGNREQGLRPLFKSPQARKLLRAARPLPRVKDRDSRFPPCSPRLTV